MRMGFVIFNDMTSLDFIGAYDPLVKLKTMGFLPELTWDKSATTHPKEYKTLKKYAKETVENRIVDEGSIVTAGGVTASIDLGLYLCEKIAGVKARTAIQLQMDYRES